MLDNKESGESDRVNSRSSETGTSVEDFILCLSSGPKPSSSLLATTSMYSNG